MPANSDCCGGGGRSYGGEDHLQTRKMWRRRTISCEMTVYIFLCIFIGCLTNVSMGKLIEILFQIFILF